MELLLTHILEALNPSGIFPKPLTLKQLAFPNPHTLEISVPMPLGRFDAQLSEKIKLRLQPIAPHLQIAFNIQIQSHRVQAGLQGVRAIKNIIAVGSGKGGVGKSTVALNLALATQRLGARVGILDADIYGPSLPLLTGNATTPVLTPEKRLEPIIAFGLQCMSIGNLVDTDAAMIWRGPMVSQALQQMLNDTLWSDLDYLFIDLPPGTGDIQLTLAQKVPLSGAVIVTTPQDLALVDAHRAIKMFEKVQVSLLGIVENMSVFICPHCHTHTSLFGTGGGARLSQQDDVPLLGHIPLDLALKEATESHLPITYQHPEHPISQAFEAIAFLMVTQLAAKEKNYAHHFSHIAVQPRS